MARHTGIPARGATVLPGLLEHEVNPWLKKALLK